MKKIAVLVALIFTAGAFCYIHAQDKPADSEGKSETAVGPMERYLPGDTMFFLKIRKAASISDYFKKSPFAKIWEEKDIQSLVKEQIETFEKDFNEGLDEFEQSSGIKIQDILNTIKGEVTFSLIDFDTKSLRGAAPPQIELVVSIEPLDKKEDFIKILEKGQKAITEEAGPGGPKQSVQTYKEQKIHCFGEDEVILTATWLGPKWVFSFNIKTLHTIIDRWLSEGIPTDSLEYDKEFAEIAKRCGGGNQEYFLYMATAPLLDKVKEDIPPDSGKIAADAGLFEPMKLGWGALLEEEDTSREIFCVLTSKEHQFMSVLGDSKINPELLVPAENIILWLSAGFDVTAQFNYLMNVLASSLRQEGQDIAEKLKELENETLGFDLENELVAAIDKSTINFFIMLPEGGGAFPELAVTLGVAKEELLNTAVEKFVDKMGEDVKSTEYRGKTIYYILLENFSDEDTEIPYWPSFSVADKKLLAASSPQVLKRMIANIEKPVKPSGNIKKALSEIPEGTYEFAYLDAKRGFSYIYNTLIPYLYKNRKEEMPEFLDPAKLPPVETFTKHLSYIYAYEAKVKNGVYGEIVSPEGPVTIPFIGAFIALAVAVESGPGFDGLTGKSAAEEAFAISTLRTISMAQELYNTRYSNYAPTLRELAEKDMIDDELATGIKNNYMFDITSDKTGKWHCIARPLTPGRRYFYIDQTGVIRESETPDIGPESAPLGH